MPLYKIFALKRYFWGGGWEQEQKTIKTRAIVYNCSPYVLGNVPTFHKRRESWVAKPTKAHTNTFLRWLTV